MQKFAPKNMHQKQLASALNMIYLLALNTVQALRKLALHAS